MFKKIILSLSFCFAVEYAEDNLRNFIQVLYVYVPSHR